MAFTPQKLHAMLIQAAHNGDLSTIQYILTDPVLKTQADIHFQNDSIFLIACQKGHHDIVEYVLTSPELTEHANIHALNNSGLKWAVLSEHYHLAAWLVESEQLTHHASVQDDPYFFITLSAQKNLTFLACLIEKEDAPLKMYYLQNKKQLLKNILTLTTSQETFVYFFNLRGELSIEQNEVNIEFLLTEWKELHYFDAIESLMHWSALYHPSFLAIHVLDIFDFYLTSGQDAYAFRLMHLMPDNTATTEIALIV